MANEEKNEQKIPFKFNPSGVISAMSRLRQAYSKIYDSSESFISVASVELSNAQIFGLYEISCMIENLLFSISKENNLLAGDYWRITGMENSNMDLSMLLPTSYTDLMLLYNSGLLDDDGTFLTPQEMIERGILDLAYVLNDAGYYSATNGQDANEIMATVVNQYMLLNGYTIDKSKRIHDAAGNVVQLEQLLEQIGEGLSNNSKKIFEGASDIALAFDDDLLTAIREKQGIEGLSVWEDLILPVPSLVNQIASGLNACGGLVENVIDFATTWGGAYLKNLHGENFVAASLLDGILGTNLTSLMVSPEDYNRMLEDTVSGFVGTNYSSLLYNGFYNTGLGQWLDANSFRGSEHYGKVTQTVGNITATGGKIATSLFVPFGYLLVGAAEGGETAQNLFSNSETNIFNKVLASSGVSFGAGALRSYVGAKGISNMVSFGAKLPSLTSAWMMNPGFNSAAGMMAGNAILNSPYTYLLATSSASGYYSEAAIEAIYGKDNSLNLAKGRDALATSFLRTTAIGSVTGGLLGRAQQNLQLAQFANGFEYPLDTSRLYNVGDYVCYSGDVSNGTAVLYSDPTGRLGFNFQPNIIYTTPGFTDATSGAFISGGNYLGAGANALSLVQGNTYLTTPQNILSLGNGPLNLNLSIYGRTGANVLLNAIPSAVEVSASLAYAKDGIHVSLTNPINVNGPGYHSNSPLLKKNGIADRLGKMEIYMDKPKLVFEDKANGIKLVELGRKGYIRFISGNTSQTTLELGETPEQHKFKKVEKSLTIASDSLDEIIKKQAKRFGISEKEATLRLRAIVICDSVEDYSAFSLMTSGVQETDTASTNGLAYNGGSGSDLIVLQSPNLYGATKKLTGLQRFQQTLMHEMYHLGKQTTQIIENATNASHSEANSFEEALTQLCTTEDELGNIVATPSDTGTQYQYGSDGMRILLNRSDAKLLTLRKDFDDLKKYARTNTSKATAAVKRIEGTLNEHCAPSFNTEGLTPFDYFLKQNEIATNKDFKYTEAEMIEAHKKLEAFSWAIR